MSNSVKTVTAAEKKRSAPKKRLLFIEEEPARVEKTKPSVVEEPKPSVVEEPKPAVVEEPNVVEEPTVVEEHTAIKEPNPVIVEETTAIKETTVVEEPNPVIVEETTAIKEPAAVEDANPTVVEDAKPAVVENAKKPQQSIWMQMRRISNMKIPLRWEGIEDISDDEDSKVDIQLLKMKKYQENIEYEKYLLRLEGFQSAGFFLNW